MINISQPVRYLGIYTNQDDENWTMLKAHAYRANQDGEVTAVMTATAAAQTISGYKGTTNNPAGAGIAVGGDYSYGAGLHGISFSVAKGLYFEIADNSPNPTAIYWHPIGTLIKPTDFN